MVRVSLGSFWTAKGAGSADFSDVVVVGVIVAAEFAVGDWVELTLGCGFFCFGVECQLLCVLPDPN